VPGVAASALATVIEYFPGASESDDSGYAELTLPLVAKSNGIFGVKQLDFQAAGRFDNIRELTTAPIDIIMEGLAGGGTATSPNLANGTLEPFTPGRTVYRATNGTVGIKYRPAEDVFFRASYSTAFVPPVYTQLLPPIAPGGRVQVSGAYPGVPTTSPWPYASVTDPLLNATYTIPDITGGNPNLKPETSRGFDWGVVFEPTFLSGLRVSLDYTKVTKRNDIIVPTLATLIASPASYPGRVTRGTPNPGATVGPIVLIDDTSINAPETITSSYNMEVDYVIKTASAGTWRFSALLGTSARKPRPTRCRARFQDADWDCPRFSPGRCKSH